MGVAGSTGPAAAKEPYKRKKKRILSLLVHLTLSINL